MSAFFVLTFTAATAALSGKYVGFNQIPIPKTVQGMNPFPFPGVHKGDTRTVAMGLTFHPEKSMAHVEFPIFDFFDPKKSCREIPYTLVDGDLKFSPSAECLARNIKDLASFRGPPKSWLELAYSYDTTSDEITINIPKGFSGWPDSSDWKSNLTWGLKKAPKLAGAVFKADNEFVDGSLIDATMSFNADGTTANFTIPQLPMSCPHEPYLAGSNEGLYIANYMSGKQGGVPGVHVKHDCVGKSLYANDVFISSIKFDKDFERIVFEGVIFDSSSSSSSSSDSSDQGDTPKSEVASGSGSSSSEEEFVFVLHRQPAEAPKSAFESFWAKALHFDF